MRINMSQTAEFETRRGVALHKSNPFVGAALVGTKTRRITNKKGDMMLVSKETEQVIAPIAGFWQAQEVDSAKFVKLYVNGVKAFRDLTGSGTKVFEILYLEVQKNTGKDQVFLSFSLLDQSITPMAKATYKRGIAELIAKGFLAATPVQGWYWLNLDYMWNGDRLAFVKEYYKAPSQMNALPEELLASTP
jgi:hypothetical protein